MAKFPSQKANTNRNASPATRDEKESDPSVSNEVMNEIKRSMAGKTFSTVEDLRAFLATLTDAGKLPGAEDGQRAAREQAQELVFDAMEAASPAHARKLAKRALEMDPDCIDAMVLLNSLEARTPEQAIEGLQHAVEAGERSLGANFARDNKGQFWLIVETRPYMRALGELANVLRGQGRHAEAINTYEKMLELNPNDNQGVRDPLLGLYLAKRDLKSASKVLQRFSEAATTNLAWVRVLERFLSEDKQGATDALKIARKKNHFVELFMGGKKAVPQNLPQDYEPGSEDEAILCVDMLASAWAAHPEAVLWLATQVQEEEMQAKILKMTPPNTSGKPAVPRSSHKRKMRS